MDAKGAKWEVYSQALTDLTLIRHDLSELYGAKTQKDVDLLVTAMRRLAKKFANVLLNQGGDVGVPYIYYIDHDGSAQRVAVYT